MTVHSSKLQLPSAQLLSPDDDEPCALAALDRALELAAAVDDLDLGLGMGATSTTSPSSLSSSFDL